MGVVETKIFKSGNSVAVRLPAELGFEAGVCVTVEKVGNEVKIKRMIDPVEEKRKLSELVAALRALGPIADPEPREPIEFPERPGL
jgi:antitoxin VapB